MPHKKSESEQYTPRTNWTADSPMDSKTVVISKTHESLTHDEVVRALGRMIVGSLTETQLSELDRDEEKRAYIRSGELGWAFDQRPEMAEQLKVALFGEDAELDKVPRAHKADPKKHTKKKHLVSKKSVVASVAAAGSIVGGASGYLAGHTSHEDMHSDHTYEQVDDAPSHEQSISYFANGRNTAEMPGKHDINDFGPPSQAGYDAEVGGSTSDLLNEWEEMFRGNAHIMATYLEVLRISSPSMPTLTELSNPATFAEFEKNLNKLGDDMVANDSMRIDLQNRLMNVLRTGKIIAIGEYSGDQISFYSDQRNKPIGIKEARVGLDRRVADRGDAAKYVTIEVTLENGSKLQFDIKPDCHLQTTWVIPAPHYQLGNEALTPVPAHTEYAPPAPAPIEYTPAPVTVVPDVPAVPPAPIVTPPVIPPTVTHSPITPPVTPRPVEKPYVKGTAEPRHPAVTTNLGPGDPMPVPVPVETHVETRPSRSVGPNILSPPIIDKVLNLPGTRTGGRLFEPGVRQGLGRPQSPNSSIESGSAPSGSNEGEVASR